MAKIKHIEYYLPSKIETNKDLERKYTDWDLSKIEKRVGIKQRHIAGEKETALDMAIKAAEKCFIQYDRQKIDFVIMCTQSPDYYLPTTACLLQEKLGLRECIGAYDFNMGCSGYIYGLAMAKSLIKTNIAKNVLLITSETYSKHIHPLDKSNRSIFGDAATATIIEDSEIEHVGEFVFGTRGSGYDKLIVKNGGFRNKYNENAEVWEYGTNNVTSDNHLYMDGPAIYEFSTEIVPKLVKETISKNNLSLDDIDCHFYHQANKFMLNHIRRSVGVEKDKFYFNIEDTGNTVSSTLPIAISKASKEGKINTGSKLILAGFGVGLSWGACFVEL